jgi:hypothetical protein
MRKLTKGGKMKKVLLLILVLVFMSYFACLSIAAPVTIIDPNGQSQVNVTNGASKQAAKASKTLSITGNGQLYTGTGNIQSINFHSAAAGDSAAIYDISDILTGPLTFAELEFELGISANNSSTSVSANGAPIKNGIYVTTKDATAITTVVIDY